MNNLDWRKWFDKMQPQTLQIAAMLLYLNGFFALVSVFDTTGYLGYIRSRFGFGFVFGLVVVGAHVGCDYHHNDGRISKTGTIGTIGCTSFFPSKNLGCYGDGGAICTNDDALAKQLKMVANHGQSVKYVHDVVGCNSRLDSMQAAVLRIKLPLLDSYCDARRKAADYYDNFFKDYPQIITPKRDPKSKHAFHQYTLQLEGLDRKSVVDHLSKLDVPSMVYYPSPAHKQGMFASFELGELDLPVTEWLTSRVISLPMHTELDEEQLHYICSSLVSFLK